MLRKIVVLGNSVALRIRPKEDSSSNNVYSVLLEKELNENFEVVNKGLSRMLVTEFVKMKDEYIREFPEYYIINIGCVDAPNRDIPLWFSNIIFLRKHHSFYRISNFIYRNIIQKVSSVLVYLRFKSPWVAPKRFYKEYSQMVSILQKETNAKIISLGINAGNDILNTKLPGTIARYIEYNEIIRDLSKKLNFEFIDVSDLVSESHFPDGVHYNLNGHQELTKRLKKTIEP